MAASAQSSGGLGLLGDDNFFAGKEVTHLANYADPSTIYTSRTRTVGVNYWLANMSHMNATMFAVEMAHEVVAIYPQVPEPAYHPINDNLSPATAVVYQEKTVPPNSVLEHLVFVCQQPGTPRELYQGRYFFDNVEPIPGRDVPVYIVDTGARLDHKEFRHVAHNVEWLHVGQDLDGRNAEDDSATDPEHKFTTAAAHGTSMLSLVTGASLGVSKGVKPILVRVPRRIIPAPGRGPYGGATDEDYLEGISKVCDHITGISTETRAILLLALHFPRKRFMRNGEDKSIGFTSRLHFLLKDLISKGVLPITGSGNNFDRSDTIDGFPANFGRNDHNTMPELIVVGGLHSTSADMAFQTDFANGLPHIFAPGAGVKTADGNRQQFELSYDEGLKSSNGTSCAAAIVAGLAAYFLRLIQIEELKINKSPLSLKNHILSDRLKWSRKAAPDGRDLPAIWNGVPFDVDHDPPYEPWTPQEEVVIPEASGSQNRSG
ncbi:peptidase S8/S53 domain-containing protein [Hypoxylon sp. NC1633]|nr:peptidase S8/S53 domain-containing protein [Hypoxylon sp. NC1633]